VKSDYDGSPPQVMSLSVGEFSNGTVTIISHIADFTGVEPQFTMIAAANTTTTTVGGTWTLINGNQHGNIW
jgi:hypothetical protein